MRFYWGPVSVQQLLIHISSPDPAIHLDALMRLHTLAHAAEGVARYQRTRGRKGFVQFLQSGRPSETIPVTLLRLISRPLALPNLKELEVFTVCLGGLANRALASGDAFLFDISCHLLWHLRDHGGKIWANLMGFDVRSFATGEIVPQGLHLVKKRKS